jgi:hypothetical protein
MKSQISLAVIIALATAGLFLTVISAGVLSDSQIVASSGTVSGVNVGVYSDPACTINCTNINWGNVAPGATVTKTVYIKNSGSIALTLSMATSNWSPANANSYLTPTWDRAGYYLSPGASISAVLTLKASAGASALATFSFNIVITGTQ